MRYWRMTRGSVITVERGARKRATHAREEDPFHGLAVFERATDRADVAGEALRLWRVSRALLSRDVPWG